MDHAVNLRPAGITLSGHFLQAGDHRRHQLHHDRRCDIGEDTQRHDAHPAQRTAAEQVEKTQELVAAEKVV